MLIFFISEEKNDINIGYVEKNFLIFLKDIKGYGNFSVCCVYI